MAALIFLRICGKKKKRRISLPAQADLKKIKNLAICLCSCLILSLLSVSYYPMAKLIDSIVQKTFSEESVGASTVLVVLVVEYSGVLWLRDALPQTCVSCTSGFPENAALAMAGLVLHGC